ncbi:MAG TPA: hypothetical protein VJM11_15280 [Nevskiaceae bacterium]|nr:hypothetical protein [Nevskiaceae bacterium]
MWRQFLALALVSLSASTVAFDDTDVGAYQAIDSEGNLTDKVFRVVHKGDDWRIEDRQNDGTWLDVTCQGGCPLEEASETQIEYWFQAATPKNVTNHCLHNDSFAFCRIERTTPGQLEIGHALVVIVEGEAYPIRLKPLGPGSDNPRAPAALEEA